MFIEEVYTQYMCFLHLNLCFQLDHKIYVLEASINLV